MNQKSLDNLIPNSERTKEELIAMGKKGGIKSGESRREKVKITFELETGDKFTVTGNTPEKAAAAAAAMEEYLYKAYKERYDWK